MFVFNLIVKSSSSSSEYLETLGHLVEDFGTYTEDSVDYPDFAIPAAQSVSTKMNDIGIIICGSGIGMSIAANKIRGIRAALCCSEETAKLARQHNNANVLCFGARTNTWENAQKMLVERWNAAFESLMQE